MLGGKCINVGVLLTLQPSSQYGRLDSYTRLEELGEGSYATVYKAISR